MVNVYAQKQPSKTENQNYVGQTNLNPLNNKKLIGKQHC
jgi:hypothetical protein